MNNARSPIPAPGVKIDICRPHHDVRRHVAGEKCKARVLTKAQQVTMNFWVMDDAKLFNILLDGKGLGSHERVDNSGVPMGTPTHFSPVTVIMPSSGSVLFINFTETLKREILIDAPEHKFAGSLSADTWGVNVDFGHVEPQFCVPSKPLANLHQLRPTLRAAVREA